MRRVLGFQLNLQSAHTLLLLLDYILCDRMCIGTCVRGRKVECRLVEAVVIPAVSGLRPRSVGTPSAIWLWMSLGPAI